MIVYILNIFILCLLGAYFYKIRYLKNANFWFCTLSFTQLFLISFLRDNIGMDYVSYQQKFNSISGLPSIGEPVQISEKGYLWLNKLISMFTHDFRVVVFVCGLIAIGLVCHTVYKNSSHPFYSIYLYTTLGFYYSSFNIMRQAIAISITIAGISYLKNRNMLKYFLVIILASLFHYSALIMIPLYFIVHIRLNYNKIILFSGVGIFIYLFLYQIVDIAFIFFPMYRAYVYSEFFKGMSIFSIVFPMFVFIGLYSFKKYFNRINEKSYIYFNIAFYGLMISLFQTKIGILDRFPYYMNIFSIFSIPMLIDCFEDEKQKRFVGFCIIILGLLYNFYFLLSGFHGVLPYKSILG